MTNTTFCIIVPTYNAGREFDLFLDGLTQQGIDKQQVLFIDSSSTDDTVKKIEDNHYPVKIIPQHEFNHGKTRQQGIDEFRETDIAIFLTQDAILDHPDCIKNIIQDFTIDETIAAVCGRQIPHKNANALAAHARYFNYPHNSNIRTKKDIKELGIKCAFMSNSFAAYKISALQDIGGFPNNTILCEDMFATAKMILKGYKISYCSKAIVRHSHNYSCIEEFKRYFDIGVFHSKEPWIQASLGGSGSTGLKYIKSEARYIITHQKSLFPKFILNNIFKLLGYKLGKNYQVLPIKLIRTFSMHKSYWN